jgi:hypothetical protein
MHRLVVLAGVALLLCGQPAGASQLIDRNATNVRLVVSSDGRGVKPTPPQAAFELRLWTGGQEGPAPGAYDSAKAATQVAAQRSLMAGDPACTPHP